jgi:hypothetical protein
MGYSSPKKEYYFNARPGVTFLGGPGGKVRLVTGTRMDPPKAPNPSRKSLIDDE